MDKHIPTEEEIVELFSRVQPRPSVGFNRKMAAQPWNRKGRVPFWAGLTPMRAAASLGLVLVLLFGISLLSPSLNTLAHRFSQFFLPSLSSQSIAEYAPLETNQPIDRFNLSISEAEALAEFEMKQPATSPEGFELIGAAYDDFREAIILHYSTKSGSMVLRISQQQPDSDFQAIGPAAIVEKVEIGPNPGEFVAGGWMIPEVESGADALPSRTSPQPIWDATVKLQTLRWSDGEFLYEIILAGGSEQPGYLDKEGLIALAKHLH